MKKDLLGFALTNAEKLQGVIDTLLNKNDPNHPYLNHQEISERMKKDLLGFARTSAEKLNSLFATLKSQGLGQTDIATLFRENTVGALSLGIDEIKGVHSLEALRKLAKAHRDRASNEERLSQLNDSTLTPAKTQTAERLIGHYLSQGKTPTDSALRDFSARHPEECNRLMQELRLNPQ